ncbi:MAG: peroxiredoxin family protein [Gemmatimonadetes bacterium]|uniref:Peroxiredoxin family protein n=1 Tax=Candidatus Kutchimonas denitrificans TaxID=3056748 RepID=A0AAE4Z6V7_9BACT|nr:peroxiredoxin family protein [Gemmatimonadota bacterium]NIR73552.1 peroxiredoxin family protein [Candidatus Kutchimonas denitrificans]NIR99511.1 peroxiredoxin family protein [Gemmatimonadota bacterium]NIT65131.1 peroxiredoxin family protein [Gemmatimonadota bacterium]NIV23664.1 redoxin domain-containing protein [Gemmatimonadota bacterium]
MHAYRDQYAQLFNDGQDVILIAISTDPVEELYAWARDDQFQFLMASDADAEVGRLYGALARPDLTNRNLFVVGPDGKIAYRAVPFREIDPAAYTELGVAIDEILSETE